MKGAGWECASWASLSSGRIRMLVQVAAADVMPYEASADHPLGRPMTRCLQGRAVNRKEEWSHDD
jgi:hypothetical protein